MAMLETLCYLGILFLASLTASQDTLPCGVFNFHSPDIVNGILSVKEKSRVNITFTILNKSCSIVDIGHINIAMRDTSHNISMPQCRIVQNSKCQSAFKNNMACQCLDTQRSYSFTFIADRKYNGRWKWSAEHDVQDDFITFNVIYAANITRLQIVGYDAVIPRYRTMLIVCTWENGNPPTMVILLDRHNNVLITGNTSGNISYTFSPVLCRHAGVIRCVAAGSDRNMSTTILTECPPEFVMTTSNIESLNINQNANVTFPFRTHTPNIDSCRIYQMIQSTDANIDHSITVFLNCTKTTINESHFTHESQYCLYTVTGEPPDLYLTIYVRIVTRKISALWYVNISNQAGSDVLYFQVNSNQEIKSSQASPFIIAVCIFGICAFTNIVCIIVYYIRKGKDAFARLKRKGKKETVMYRGLGTDSVEHYQSLSRIYFEIEDTQENDTQSMAARKFSVGVSDFPLHATNLGSVCCFQAERGENKNTNSPEDSARGENKNSNSPEDSARIKRIMKENKFSSRNTSRFQTFHSESDKNSVHQESDDPRRVLAENETWSPITRRLKIVHVGSELLPVP